MRCDDTRFVLGLLGILVAMQVLTACGVYIQPLAQKRFESARKLVLLSIDGARTDITYGLASKGFLPGFKRIMDEGVYSDGMLAPFPSVTAVSHAVISTGADPSVTGITSNSIHLPRLLVNKTVSGFDGEYLLAEPIWMTADRQGMKVAVTYFPQCTLKQWSSKLTTVLSDLYSSLVSPICQSTLYTPNRTVTGATYVVFNPAANWISLERLGEVHRPHDASVRLGDSIWWLLVYDSNNDDILDKLAIVPDGKDASKAITILTEGEWSRPLYARITHEMATHLVAPKFKSVRISDLNDFRLYRSPVGSLDAPWLDDKLLQYVWSYVIASVGTLANADSYALSNGWIDDETYMETVRYTSELWKRSTEYLLRNSEWSLLITYVPIIDDVYHDFLGYITPDMPYYDPIKAPKYEEYIRRTHIWADEIVQTILGNVNLAETAVIVLSDHGQWALKKRINVNSILYNAGLIEASDTGNLLWNRVKAYYVGYNQIFVNLRNREEQGAVGEDEYQEVIDRVKEALARIVDPDTAKPVFDAVMTRQEASAYGLAGERVGDIVFSLHPGYATPADAPKLSEARKAEVFSDARGGGHGDLPFHKDLHGIFGAVGARIVHGKIDIFRSTSIAPTISAILGIEPPERSTGTALAILGTKTISTSAVISATVSSTAARAVELTGTTFYVTGVIVAMVCSGLAIAVTRLRRLRASARTD
mgnify:CR=1 FL=1